MEVLLYNRRHNHIEQLNEIIITNEENYIINNKYYDYILLFLRNKYENMFNKNMMSLERIEIKIE